MEQNALLSSQDLLQYAVQNGMLDLAVVQEQANMSKRKEILDKYPYKIWTGKDGLTRTYIPDSTKPNNRRLIKRKSRIDVEDEVIQYMREHEEILRGEQPVVNLTLVGIFPRWIEFKAKHTNSSSYTKRITTTWKKYYSTQPEFINKPISSFTKVELDAWAHDMIRNHNMTKKQYYNMSVILRQELDFAVDNGWISSNVFSEVKINTKLFVREKKKPSNTQVYLTNEAPAMITEMINRFREDPTHTNPLMVLLAFEIGTRVGELVALKREDIAPDWSMIHIQRQEIRTYEKVDNDGFVMKMTGFKVVEYTKTEDGDRYVYLTKTAVKIIQTVLSVNERYGYFCDDYLFVDGNKRISQNAVSYQIKDGCKHAQIPEKSSHKIRKTYISSLIDSGLNINEIRRQVGHADERTTYGNYCFNRATEPETRQLMEQALSYNYPSTEMALA